MPSRTDRNGLVVLQRDECLARLRKESLGRIAITIDALPVILPVNYRLVDDTVVFTTYPGAKLDAAAVGAVVAFEIDGTDRVAHGGWSVVVTGIAEVVTDPGVVARLDRANVPRWAPGPGERYVAIPTTLVSGRMLL